MSWKSTWIGVAFLWSLTGCGGAAGSPVQRMGKGGSLKAAIYNSAGSNVDTNPYVGVSDGGAESVGGEYLAIDTSMDLSADLTQSLSLRINEASSYQYYWTPGPGVIALGPMSPSTVHFIEQYVSETGIIWRDWMATGGSLEIVALSKTAVSFTIHDASMSTISVAATGSFSLDAVGDSLVF